MTIDYQKLRLYGVYQQDKEENLMLRVKIPAGFLSSEQATTIAIISKECSNGMLHLTSRGSFEFHWLKHHQLDDILAEKRGDTGSFMVFLVDDVFSASSLRDRIPGLSLIDLTYSGVISSGKRIASRGYSAASVL